MKIRLATLIVGLGLILAGCSAKQVSCPFPENKQYLLQDIPYCEEGVKPTQDKPCVLDCTKYFEDRQRIACAEINNTVEEEVRKQLQDAVKGMTKGE